MRNPIPHLHRNRHGTYYFRITTAGKTIKRSLGTKNVELATMHAARLNYEWDTMSRTPTVADVLQAAQQGNIRKLDVQLPNGVKLLNINSEADTKRAERLLKSAIPQSVIAAAAAPLAESMHAKGPTFKTVARQYLDELQAAKLEEDKGILDKEATYAAFIDEFENPRMGAVSKDNVAAFKNIALKTGGPSRVNKKLGHLSVLYDWAIAHGHVNSNPIKGMRIGKKSQHARKVQHYEPFTSDDLKKIFNARTYPTYATKEHFKWMPLLLLYTGARPDEIASLSLDNVRREKAGRVNIDYFAITAGKTTSSLRKVPFHKVIRESGFMAYLAQRRKEEPDGMLFPLLKPTKNGHAKNVSRRFNENYLPEVRITTSTKRLYSFRSTFITRMSELNVHPAMLMALVGHYEQDAVDLSSPHFKNYQGTKKLAALQDTIDKFDVKLPMKF